MKDIQKQILYNKYLHGDIKLKDITTGDLNTLVKGHWFDHLMKAQPSFADYTVFLQEIRRRDQEAATKPMKPIDRGFFK
jgi:hypothetical protein